MIPLLYALVKGVSRLLLTALLSGSLTRSIFLTSSFPKGTSNYAYSTVHNPRLSVLRRTFWRIHAVRI